MEEAPEVYFKASGRGALFELRCPPEKWERPAGLAQLASAALELIEQLKRTAASNALTLCAQHSRDSAVTVSADPLIAEYAELRLQPQPPLRFAVELKYRTAGSRAHFRIAFDPAEFDRQMNPAQCRARIAGLLRALDVIASDLSEALGACLMEAGLGEHAVAVAIATGLITKLEEEYSDPAGEAPYMLDRLYRRYAEMAGLPARTGADSL